MTQANSFILHDENFPKDPSTGQWKTSTDSLHTKILGILQLAPLWIPTCHPVLTEATLHWGSDAQGTPASLPREGSGLWASLLGPDARSPCAQMLVVGRSGVLAPTLACRSGVTRLVSRQTSYFLIDLF